MSEFFSQIVEPVRNESLDVSTSSILVSQARNEINPRKVILIRNISGDGTRISINLGINSASADTGIILEDGESYTESEETGYKAFQGMITGIANAVTGKLSIMER